VMATASRSLAVTGAREIAAEFALDAAELDSACRDLTRSNAEELRRRIQHNAMTGVHGPNQGHIPGTGPGPNVVTGDYVRSWEIDHGPVGAQVWTDAPQANRLEYGFHGVDSAGRRFNQPAYPHIAPAVDGVEERMGRQLDGIVAGLVRGVGFGAGAVFSG
jgi:hypothetical protein